LAFNKAKGKNVANQHWIVTDVYVYGKKEGEIEMEVRRGIGEILAPRL